MFKTILIANRGEIACRVAATARRMGIRTIAVYSDADARSRHVAMCDEAWRLGPAAARESYLRADLVLEIALKTGAQAIHPGYGFLSENEGFARAVAEAGLVFIGPPASAIAAMGSKSAAKALMEKAQVPLVPGYHGDNQDPGYLRGQADAIGYPVLIKASAGGGGKGMRIVTQAGQFDAALASCKREAASAFSDDAVLIERYVQRPRHVEIQVFADGHGNCVYLFERDCSVQRRHQKVIEEAPGAGHDRKPARAHGPGGGGGGARRRLPGRWHGRVHHRPGRPLLFHGDEHPAAGRASGHRDDHRPRPGRMAAAGGRRRAAAGAAGGPGHPRPRDRGARLRGEPRQGLPAFDRAARAPARTGRASPSRSAPRARGGARPNRRRCASTAACAKAMRSAQYYDPMIAKLIVWGNDREQAIARMSTALSGYEIVGPATNVAFLRRLMRCDAFSTADLDTGLIERERAALLPAPRDPEPAVLAQAAAAVLMLDAAADAARTRQGDPWAARSGWRGGTWLARTLLFGRGSVAVAGAGRLREERFHRAHRRRVGLPGRSVAYDADARGACAAWPAASAFDVGAVLLGETLHLFTARGAVQFGYAPALAHVGEDADAGGGVTAPMPGKVVADPVRGRQACRTGRTAGGDGSDEDGAHD